ncbi:tape measure protein [Nocardia beijingensis]
MAVELAEAYVSLVIEGSKVPGQVEKALNGAQPSAEKAGRGLGSRMMSGIAATARTAAAGVGLAAGATLGTALSQGFQRMTAIDDAKGKLAGLGHEASGVATIMESALASVKGTAFGLGEAATIAASAVAAGVKPGEQLTKYLKLTADAATIAGTSLGDMGSILNKVTTSGKAYTDDLNQLSDRGIPIFTWLQQEYGKSAEGLSKMVKDGKVDAATFQKVIEKNIGGAALQSGKTLRGAYSNLKAALGRVGEGALSPFLPIMKSALGSATEWADKVTPRVKASAQNVADGLTSLGRAFQSNGASVDGSANAWEQWGIRARHTADGIRGIWSILKDGDFKGSAMTFGLSEDSGVVRTMFRLREAAIALWAALRSPEREKFQKFWDTLRGGTDRAAQGMKKIEDSGMSLSAVLGKLGNAGSSIGKSLLSLTGDTGTVIATGLHLVGSAMAFLANHTGVATTAIVGLTAAFAAQKLIHTGFEASKIAQAIMTPAQIASTVAMTRALGAHNDALRAYLAAMGHEVPAQATTLRARIAATAARIRETIATRAATSALGTYAAAQRAAAASSGLLVAGMRQVAAGAASVGSRVQATATTALSGFRSAAAGVLGMLGGPWGIALAAGGAAIMAHMSAVEQARRVHDALSSAVVQGAKAQTTFVQAVSAANGALDVNALASATKVVESNLAGITEVAKEGHSAWSSFQKNVFTWNAKDVNREYAEVQRAIDQNDTLRKVLQDMRLEISDLGPIVAQGGSAYDDLIRRFEATGDAGADVVTIFKRSREELKGSADAVRNSTPGFGNLASAIQTLANNSATADQRLSAMKRALDALSGKPIELGDAMQRFNKELRDTQEIAKTWDRSQGFGPEQLIMPDGSINTGTENGDRLRTNLVQLRDSILDVAKAGGDLGPVFASVNTEFGKLGAKTGLSEQQIKDLAESVGLIPRDIEILARVEGADKATQDLTTIKLLLENNRQGATIDTKLLGDADVINRLRDAGATVTEVTDKPGVFKIEAPNMQKVIDQLQKLIDAKIPDKRVNVTYAEATASGEWRAPMPFPAQRATGGGIFGAGGPTSDSIPALLSNNEHVWTSAEVDAVGGHGKMRQLRSIALAGGLKFAKGGTPFGISEAVKAAQDVEGNKYQWGGIGPTNFDCSGFIGWLQQIAMGLGRVVKRIYTTYTLLDGSTAGLEPGLGPSGTWFRVGVSPEHMAATIGNTPVESGGANGTSGIGGNRAGAEDSQFPYKFHLPNRLIAGYQASVSGGKLIEWTDEDERELERLAIGVEEAKRKRDEIYSKEDSTPNERRLADLDVQDAQSRVVKKQEQKDKKGTVEGGSRYAPQAPGLAKKYSADEKSYLSALQAVEQANQRRNEVYDDPESTDTDKALADIEWQDAVDKLENGDASDTNKPKSVRDVLTSFAANMVGVGFDAFKAQLPDAIGGSRWWDVADQAIALSNTDQKSPDSARQALTGLPTFGIEQFLGQLGYNPKREVPEWAQKMKPPKVYDSGGWLMPGEMGINLSNKPEPIFNSPEQLRAFTGNQLQPAQGGGLTEQDVERIMRLRPEYHVHTQDVSGAVQAIRVEQKRQAMGFMRR